MSVVADFATTQNNSKRATKKSNVQLLQIAKTCRFELPGIPP
jgi:hypothetical protein